MRKIVSIQFFILLGGTLFAWGNFIFEMASWLNQKSCVVGCAAGANPFVTPCFWGALFFTLAFVFNIAALKKVLKQGR